MATESGCVNLMNENLLVTPLIHKQKYGGGPRPSSLNLRRTLPSLSFEHVQESTEMCVSKYLLTAIRDALPFGYAAKENPIDYNGGLYTSSTPHQDVVTHIDDALAQDDMLFFHSTPSLLTPAYFSDPLASTTCLSAPENTVNRLSQSSRVTKYSYKNSTSRESLRWNAERHTLADNPSSNAYTSPTSLTDNPAYLTSSSCRTPFFPWGIHQSTDCSMFSSEGVHWINMAMNSPDESLLPLCALTNENPACLESPISECWFAPAQGHDKTQKALTPGRHDESPQRDSSLDIQPQCFSEPSSVLMVLDYALKENTYVKNKSSHRPPDDSHLDIRKQASTTKYLKRKKSCKWTSSTSTTRSSSLCLVPNSRACTIVPLQCFPAEHEDTITSWTHDHIFTPPQSVARTVMRSPTTPTPSDFHQEFNTSDEPSGTTETTVCHIQRDPLNAEKHNDSPLNGFIHLDLDSLSSPPEPCVSGFPGESLGPQQSTDVHQFVSLLKTHNILSLAKDQTGSRRLQFLLNQKNKEIITYVLKESKTHLTELMIDLYGNYFCQGLFQVCSYKQRILMLESLSPDICLIASDARGTHALQAFIILIKSRDEQTLLIQHLQEHFFFLSTHPFGTHVIQQTIECFHPSVTSVMFQYIIQNVNYLAENPHGVCVVKRGITLLANHAPHHEKCRCLQKSLRDKLSKLTFSLSQSPFGNYAIQHAIQIWGPDLSSPILRQISEHIIDLATQKFSSNVVEEMLGAVSQQELLNVLKKMTLPGNIRRVMNSGYGNFVVKKAFGRCPASEANLLMPVWLNEIKFIQNKRLKTKWEKTLNAITKPQDLNTSSHLTPTCCKVMDTMDRG